MKIIAFLLFLAPALMGQSEAALQRFFEGKRVRVKIDMPATHEGVDYYFGRNQPLDFREYSTRVRLFGVALRSGDEVMITVIATGFDPSHKRESSRRESREPQPVVPAPEVPASETPGQAPSLRAPPVRGRSSPPTVFSRANARDNTMPRRQKGGIFRQSSGTGLPNANPA